ncbi:hypothetical protein GNI_157790 [Gregarina niphandrodes]|uniref:Uncharacterized protein n=1 Tax=Gregarina niphandrodes TaxID=110365 RepID=A0A023AYS1_GRENI|nr:hypothetical protein GNI_157790 [Gregarina niphandrodes]EZG43816.1 hypothetical protein GNI_157790 [Gregarina niphandrodes]|eukprot:XP_011133000.1 hypothetical protein GNI_157790 [Gregarina niphandrodes]
MHVLAVAEGSTFVSLPNAGLNCGADKGETGKGPQSGENSSSPTSTSYVPRMGRMTAYARPMFANSVEGYLRLRDSLSEQEWKAMESINDSNLETCRLDYLELAGIIGLFVDFPFGAVKGDIFRRLKMNTAERDIWTSGCLLECAKVPTRKLLEMCVNKLNYNPGVQIWVLESFRAKRLRYSSYLSRSCDDKSLARGLLEPVIRQLRHCRLSVSDFLDRQVEKVSQNESFVSRIFSQPDMIAKITEDFVRRKEKPAPAKIAEESVTPTEEEAAVGPLIYVATSGGPTKLAEARDTFRDDFDAYEKLQTVLPTATRQRLKKVSEIDFRKCGLDYLELGQIISLYVDNPFGGVWPREGAGHDPADVLGVNPESRKADVWTTGCLLQYAAVPISDLVDFCSDTLGFATRLHGKPSLECLKPATLTYINDAERPAHGRKERLAQFMDQLKDVTLTSSEFAAMQCKNFLNNQQVTVGLIAANRAKNIAPEGGDWLGGKLPSEVEVEVETGTGKDRLVWEMQQPGDTHRPSENVLRFRTSKRSPEMPVYILTDCVRNSFALKKPAVIKDDAEAAKIVDELLPASVRMNMAFNMKVEDLLECRLDYVEAARIICKYIKKPFGSITHTAQQKFLEYLDKKKKVVNLQGWMSGCILRYAKVPIDRLKRVCIETLRFIPNPDPWFLECLRIHPMTISHYNRVRNSITDPDEYLATYENAVITADTYFELQTHPRQIIRRRLQQLVLQPHPQKPPTILQSARDPSSHDPSSHDPSPGAELEPRRGIKRLFPHRGRAFPAEEPSQKRSVPVTRLIPGTNLAPATQSAQNATVTRRMTDELAAEVADGVSDAVTHGMADGLADHETSRQIRPEVTDQLLAEQLADQLNSATSLLEDADRSLAVFVTDRSANEFLGSTTVCPKPEAVTRNSVPSMDSVLGVFAEEMQHILPPMSPCSLGELAELL